MNRLLKIQCILFLLLFSTIRVWSQSPSVINYQGVAHQSNGNALANQLITLRLSVRQATANGPISFSETRQVTTSSDGLFHIQIGSAGALSTTGAWSAIAWESGSKFLQVEMDALGGSNFITIGTQELVSVPYALHANQAGALVPTATITPSQLNGSGASTNDVLQFDGTHWVPASLISGSLALPFLGSDPSLVSFGVTNNSALGGSAIYGKANTSNINASGVRGESVGALGNGVYGKAAGASSFGVLGQNTTGTGVKGVANAVNATGVYGESASGTGVKGYSNDPSSVAVWGSSLAGTGVKAYSYVGTALDVNGKTVLDGGVKISGGNTNPSNGAVLKSDADGNAVWKNPNIGFLAKSNPSVQYLADNALVTIASLANYDASNNMGTALANTFIAPTNGFYHFGASAYLKLISGAYNLEYGYIYIYKNGYEIAMQEYANPKNTSWESTMTVRISQDINLLAGDEITIKVKQDNPNGQTCWLTDGVFYGHLIFGN